MQTFMMQAFLIAGCAGPPASWDDSAGAAPTSPDDADGDGFPAATDCDDDNAQVNPGVAERCNGIDDDCDGGIDNNAVDADAYYTDADGDGWGDPDTEQLTCQADGLVAEAGDCDDTDSARHPDTVWYDDSDGDGFGTDEVAAIQCEPWPGGSLSDGDCNDNDPEVHPDAVDDCDGFDSDCDGTMDEDGDNVWYLDSDGDGWGDEGSTTQACWLPSGYTDNAWDCDDGDDTVHPGAPEVCTDAIDHDCNGYPDNGCSVIDVADSDYLHTPELGGDGPIVALGDADGDGIDDVASTNGFYQVVITEGLDEEVATVSTESEQLGFNLERLGNQLLITHQKADFDSDILAFELPIDGNLTPEDADGVLAGNLSSNGFGYGLDDVGDQDGDGLADFVVGAPLTTELWFWDGAAWLLPGPVTSDMTLDDAIATVTAATGLQRLGETAAGGDWNADGIADLAIGAPYAEAVGGLDGRVYLFDGPSSGAMTDADSDGDIVPVAEDSGFGEKIAAGDIDGDGYDDLAIRAGWESPETIYLLHGPLSGSMAATDARARLMEDVDDTEFGVSFELADNDGDGTQDLLVGVPFSDDNAGAAYLFHGPHYGVRITSYADHTVVGAEDDKAGLAVSLAADLDGDGANEPIVCGASSVWGFEL